MAGLAEKDTLIRLARYHVLQPPAYRCHQDAPRCYLPTWRDGGNYWPQDSERWGVEASVEDAKISQHATVWCDIEAGGCYATEQRCRHFSGVPCETRDAE